MPLFESGLWAAYLSLSLMTQRAVALVLATSAAVFFPSDAHAQKIPWIVLPLVASPIFALILATTLGVTAKRWSVGLWNVGLVIIWVIWFLAASRYSTSDLVIWASLVALAVHSLIMLWLIALHVFRRMGVRNEA
jgi:hypothetical protein